MIKNFIFLFLAFTSYFSLFSQDDLLSRVKKDSAMKEYVTRAFKSSRVINGHSIEMIPKGNLDFRILHRFGLINTGIKNLFGLDQANMRIGLDYGLGTNLTVGIGRSNIGKELDGFVKYRVLRQSTGPNSFPFSVVLLAGASVTTIQLADPNKYTDFSSRLCYFYEVIAGRKFTESFSLQISPVMIHRNMVPLATDKNDAFALGIGARYRLSRRVAFVTDYHIILSGLDRNIYRNPLAIGFDIETGGHVFQLHFSNTQGMNEKAFITGTTEKFFNGDIRFGFNISRMFVIRKHLQKTD